MTKLLTVLGTRPEIIKLSPLVPLLEARLTHVLVHTGQHYDDALDRIFFEELGLRAPDYRLDVGSGSHATQTAGMLIALEAILNEVQPDAVLVQGDTNSTLAGALAAGKLGIPVIHLEAGCRSFNRRMPEELNRVLVDHCAELLLVADQHALDNLRAEGCEQRAVLVGSTAIDACLRSVRFANRSPILDRLRLSSRGYLLCTIHRAENTTAEVLPGLIAALNELAGAHPLVVPLHPRTAAAMRTYRLAFAPQVRVIPPLGYLDLLQLLRHARAVMTDSGGLQEEAAALNVPLLVLRAETEWTYLVRSGKAILLGNHPETILPLARQLLAGEALEQMRRRVCVLERGAAARAVDTICAWLGSNEVHDAHPPAYTLAAGA
ncbi:non-hydrolyzing UDP-N-acetylglucosamine 2-epimerase [Kallotenue papyrolyticum]|uniref:non-hydrolyzing UDP-N-acetylglucosamine 2-epimerase n=1 Tax=Kallotenue papyrolyticum TaxID=1325125 RepID=UPI0004785F6C|nr:UDP-N-acetylglucosamine 2-epimerase (non-hydrolyzing) [Kallotenue papyrolyticum]